MTIDPDNPFERNRFNRSARKTVNLTRTIKTLVNRRKLHNRREFAGEAAWLFIVIKTRILHNNLKLERKYNTVLSIVIDCHDMFKLIR